jgi:hypothetical protein
MAVVTQWAFSGAVGAVIARELQRGASRNPLALALALALGDPTALPQWAMNSMAHEVLKRVVRLLSSPHVDVPQQPEQSETGTVSPQDAAPTGEHLADEGYALL